MLFTTVVSISLSILSMSNLAAFDIKAHFQQGQVVHVTRASQCAHRLRKINTLSRVKTIYRLFDSIRSHTFDVNLGDEGDKSSTTRVSY